MPILQERSDKLENIHVDVPNPRSISDPVLCLIKTHTVLTVRKSRVSHQQGILFSIFSLCSVLLKYINVVYFTGKSQHDN